MKKGFAVVKRWEWLRERFGSGTISRMALIQKQNDDGRVKNRLIVDMLRSGGNARASVGERWVLPRVIDVLEAARRLYKHSGDFTAVAQKEGWMPEDAQQMHEWELIGADLQDASCHFPVAKEEVSNLRVSGLREGEVIIYTALLFGFKAAPLLMARLAALLPRLLQSLFAKGEGCLQTYIDDPLFILAQ